MNVVYMEILNHFKYRPYIAVTKSRRLAVPNSHTYCQTTVSVLGKGPGGNKIIAQSYFPGYHQGWLLGIELKSIFLIY